METMKWKEGDRERQEEVSWEGREGSIDRRETEEGEEEEEGALTLCLKASTLMGRTDCRQQTHPETHRTHEPCRFRRRRA